MSELSEKFRKKVEAVVAFSKRVAEGLRNTEQPVAERYADDGIDKPGPKRFETDLHSEFDRGDLVDEYKDVRADATTSPPAGGTVTDIWRIRLQHDWLESMERDYWLRERTRIRTEAHAASKRTMQGDEDGPARAVLRYGEYLLKQSGNKGGGSG